MMLAVTAGAFLLVTWVATKGLFFFPPRVSDPLKPPSKPLPAYEEATSDEQAALRAWMSGIILPGKARRQGLEKCKSNEKESL